MSALTREERIALERACEDRVETIRWLLGETYDDAIPLEDWLRERVWGNAKWCGESEAHAERECLRSVLRRLRCGEPLEGP